MYSQVNKVIIYKEFNIFWNRSLSDIVSKALLKSTKHAYNFSSTYQKWVVWHWSYWDSCDNRDVVVIGTCGMLPNWIPINYCWTCNNWIGMYGVIHLRSMTVYSTYQHPMLMFCVFYVHSGNWLFCSLVSLFGFGLYSVDTVQYAPTPK